MVQHLLRRAVKKQSILKYLYVDSTVKKRHKTQVLLAHNQGSTLFAEVDTPIVIVTYNFWKVHRMIVFDPSRSRHFRLDATNREQLFAINIT